MTLKDLQQKIGELLEHYNRDLAYDEDDRVGAAQLIFTRPEERVTKESPASVFITSKGFAAEVKEGRQGGTDTVVRDDHGQLFFLDVVFDSMLCQRLGRHCRLAGRLPCLLPGARRMPGIFRSQPL